MMKTTCSFSMFCDAFNGGQYKNNFSRAGLVALWGYLEELDDEGLLGDDFDPLDVVALACDYSEHENVVTCATEYGHSIDDCDDEEEQTNTSLEFLRDHTQVLEFDGGIIIQDF